MQKFPNSLPLSNVTASLRNYTFPQSLLDIESVKYCFPGILSAFLFGNTLITAVITKASCPKVSFQTLLVQEKASLSENSEITSVVSGTDNVTFRKKLVSLPYSSFSYV